MLCGLAAGAASLDNRARPATSDCQSPCPASHIIRSVPLRAAASSGRESLALLETLQRLMTAQRERALEDGELLRDDDLLVRKAAGEGLCVRGSLESGFECGR